MQELTEDNSSSYNKQYVNAMVHAVQKENRNFGKSQKGFVWPEGAAVLLRPFLYDHPLKGGKRMPEQCTVPEVLEAFFQKHRRIAIAFSGGTDSAYLLYAANYCGCEVCAYYVHSQFQPRFELEDAKKLAGQLGVPMVVLEVDVLSVPEIAANPENRCYYCKHALFARILDAAQRDGFPILCDGTNATDDAGDRPGMRALRELSVHSPLRECGIGKPEVRVLSKKAGLFTWNKPAYACLATRMETGTAIEADMLKKVEHAEQALMEMGFSDLRVRIFHGAARLQLPESQYSLALQKHREITSALQPDFPVIMLDLNPR